jgi:hypothetical protein
VSKGLKRVASISAVDIAIYGAQRFELGDFVGQLNRSNIASVPNLINVA